jgi:hypothetical protein
LRPASHATEPLGLLQGGLAAAHGLLGLRALSHVHRGSDVLEQRAVFSRHRVRDAVQAPDRPVRQDDPVLVFVVGLRAHALRPDRVHERTIVGMDARDEEVLCELVLLWVEAEHAKHFRRSGHVAVDAG